MKATMTDTEPEIATLTYQPPAPESRASARFKGLTDRLCTELELASYLRICRRQLYSWRMNGIIPYLKIGRAVRFRPGDVERALKAMTINPNR